MRYIQSLAVLALLSSTICVTMAQPQGGRGTRGGFGGGDGGGRPRGNFGGAQGTGGRSGFGGGPGGGSGQRPGSGGGTRSAFGGGGGRPSFGGGGTMLASRFDSNGDGRIDQNEINGMSDGFKQVLASRGIRLQPGSIEEFSNSMRQQFERSREQQGGAMSSGRSQESSSAGNRTEYAPSTPFRPREKERMTVDLPASYTSLDTDFDGQIELYEWLIERRDQLELFEQIDVNTDAILTPRELTDHDGLSVSGDSILAVFKEKYARPRLTIVGSDGISIPGKDGKTVRKLTDEEKQRHTESANRIFGYVDTNKDGKIAIEEITKNPRIGPMFERAGIKPSNMSQADFAKIYVEAIEKSGGDFGRGRGPGGDASGGERGRGGPGGGRTGFGGGDRSQGGGGPGGGRGRGGGGR